MSTTTTDPAPSGSSQAGDPAARRRRARWHRAGIGAIAAGAALTSTGCTLSDISTILSILRLLGIIA